MKKNEVILKPEEFRNYKQGHVSRKEGHNDPSKGVDTSRDPYVVYFQADTLRVLLSADFEYFVFFMICDGMASKFHNLSVMVAGFDSPATPKTPFYQAHIEKGENDAEVAHPLLCIGNYIKRCEAVSNYVPIRYFNPLNEFKGYAHERTGLIKTEILDKGATFVVVYFGVNPYNRLTVMMVGADKDYVPFVKVEDDDSVVDNGTMCCPIPEE